MLLNDLSNTIKKMKTLDSVENAALDAEKKAKNDSDYKALVMEFSAAVSKLSQVTAKMDFTISNETIEILEECINRLDQVVSSGVVESDSLNKAKQQNKKVNPALNNEWNKYYHKKTSVCISKINTIGKLASEPERISKIRNDIDNGSEWENLTSLSGGNNTRLELLTKGIEYVDSLEESLSLSEEVKDFIILVSTKRAHVSDLTDTVLEWIKNEKLEDKFSISFNVNFRDN